MTRPLVKLILPFAIALGCTSMGDPGTGGPESYVTPLPNPVFVPGPSKAPPSATGGSAGGAPDGTVGAGGAPDDGTAAAGGAPECIPRADCVGPDVTKVSTEPTWESGKNRQCLLWATACAPNWIPVADLPKECWAQHRSCYPECKAAVTP